MDILSGGNDLGTLGLGLLIAGVAAGLVSGVLGRGAGLIVVPALFLAARSAGLTPETAFHLAAGTGFAVLVPISLGLLAAQAKSLDWGAARRALGPLAIGVAVGSWLGLTVTSLLLVLAFAAVGLGAAGLTLGITAPRRGQPAPFAGATIAFVQGTVASALGLGGGSFGAPLLTASGMESDKANAMAGLFAVAIAATGAVVAAVAGWDVHGLPRYSYGYVNLMAFAVVAPAAFGASLVGAHYAKEIDAKKTRLMFAAIVAFSVVRMVWAVVG